MKIILLKDIRNAGKAGEIKEVSAGYGRNFLLPRKLAILADKKNLKRAEEISIKRAKQEEMKVKDIKAVVQRLKDKKITIKAKAKEGKLFGSVGQKEIIEALAKEGLKISPEKIILPAPIKKIGEQKVEINLGFDAKFKVVIIVSEE